MQISLAFAVAIAVVLNAFVLVAIPVLFGAPVEQMFLAPVIIFLVVFSAWIVAEPRAQKSFMDGAVVVVGHQRSNWLDWCSAPTLLLLCVAAMIEFGTGRSIAIRSEIFGAYLMLLGIGLRLSAIRGLRRHFLDQVSLLPGHKLVTTGIFAFIRHPAESGLLLIGSGTALCLGSRVAAIIVVLVLLPLAFRRTAKEDALLHAEFHGLFSAYRDDVGRLVPRLSPGCWSARRTTRP